MSLWINVIWLENVNFGEPAISAEKASGFGHAGGPGKELLGQDASWGCFLLFHPKKKKKALYVPSVSLRMVFCSLEAMALVIGNV